MQGIRVCRICDNRSGNETYIAREQQLGLGDEFEYFKCSECGCLQISEIPTDLSKYYPPNYYSYRPCQPSFDFSRTGVGGYKLRLVVRLLTRHYYGRKNVVGKLLSEKSVVSGEFPLWVRRQQLDLKLRPTSRILDVGCGRGQALVDLHALGFKNLTGADPFLESDFTYDNGIRIYKRNIDEMEGEFDFIMLNHSFEHMPDQLSTLAKLKQLVKSNCYLLIRIPVVDSYYWRQYGLNWAALDAPRHLYLHTRESLKLLATQAGFTVSELVFDSDGFTSWASEQYAAGISLVDPRSYNVNPASSIFKKEDIDGFTRLATQLNDKGDSDYAAFLLRA